MASKSRKPQAEDPLRAMYPQAHEYDIGNPLIRPFLCWRVVESQFSQPELVKVEFGTAFDDLLVGPPTNESLLDFYLSPAADLTIESVLDQSKRGLCPTSEDCTSLAWCIGGALINLPPTLQGAIMELTGATRSLNARCWFEAGGGENWCRLVMWLRKRFPRYFGEWAEEALTQSARRSVVEANLVPKCGPYDWGRTHANAMNLIVAIIAGEVTESSESGATKEGRPAVSTPEEREAEEAILRYWEDYHNSGTGSKKDFVGELSDWRDLDDMPMRIREVFSCDRSLGDRVAEFNRLQSRHRHLKK